MYRIVGTNRDASKCDRCGRAFLSRVVWLQCVSGSGKDLGTPRPYGTDCAARLAGRSVPAMERAAKLAGCRMPARRGTESGNDMPLFAEPTAPGVVETASRAEAYRLMAQAQSNRVWAALMGGLKADQLNAVADEMDRAAIQIIGAPTLGEPEISDADLMESLMEFAA